MKGFLMIKQVKRPIKISRSPDFNKDFYCQYKPNFIKYRLLRFHAEILEKEKEKNK